MKQPTKKDAARSVRVPMEDRPWSGGDRPDPSTGSGAIDEFDAGVLIGILVGEGHFGGDGRQPQVTLRMHADHRALFEWLIERFPDSRLYGPYEHAGRRYYQWMARGRFLRQELLPILRARLRPEHSRRVWDRYVAMCTDYGLEGLADGVRPADEGREGSRG